MIDRFANGAAGQRLLLDTLSSQKLVLGNTDLADQIAHRCELMAVVRGTRLIEQGADDNDIFFILAGSFDIVINGRMIARRGPTDHVGEMSAIEPAQRRSANVVAATDAVVARLSEPDFNDIASRHPVVYRRIAQALSRRLLERNVHVGAYREQARVLILSSAEALPIARAVLNAFAHDLFLSEVWTDGCFKISNYTLQSLEDKLNTCDFAVAIAHTDDVTTTRGQDWPSPRDNVVFELGLFMGRLGKSRAVLMEPRELKVKLPSDLAGVTTIPYRFSPGTDAAVHIAPACNQLRDHINALGPYNG